MIQPLIAASALADKMLNNQGFLSRILACKPKSLIGARLYRQPPPESGRILQEYEGRVLKILSTPYPLADKTAQRTGAAARDILGGSEGAILELSQQRRAPQTDGGAYESIKPFASKLKEHAARLAVALAYYQRPDVTELTDDDFRRGIPRHLLRGEARDCFRQHHLSSPSRLKPRTRKRSVIGCCPAPGTRIP